MKKKIISFGIPAVACFALAAVLLAGGVVGSARAALNYYSEDYLSDIEVPRIGVALYEQTGDAELTEISYRYYADNGDGTGEWKEPGEDEKKGLLTSFSGEKPEIGKKYEEKLTVVNKGTSTIYVRAHVYRYWTDKDGKKDQSLDPSLIELTMNGNWQKDESADTEEREVWYYTKPLEASVGETVSEGGTSDPLVESFRISEDVYARTEDNEEGEVTYLYDGKKFNLEIEVDAIQADNGAEAARSVWSKQVSVDEATGTLSLAE